MEFLTIEEKAQLKQILVKSSQLQTPDDRQHFLTICGLEEYCGSIQLDKPLEKFVMSSLATLSKVYIQLNDTSRLGLLVFLEHINQFDNRLAETEHKFIKHVINKWYSYQVKPSSNVSSLEAIDLSICSPEILEMDSRTIQKNLTDLEKKGTPEQCREAISQTSSWLQIHPNESYVRRRYLILVRERGELEQQKQAIVNTALWMKDNLKICDSYVFTEYLRLVTKSGTLEHCQQVSSQVSIWLQKSPNELFVRRQWLVMAREKLNLEQCQNVISQTAYWLSENLSQCDSYVMMEYLRLNNKAGTFQQRQEAITKAESWLEANPSDSYVRNQYLALLKKQE